MNAKPKILLIDENQENLTHLRNILQVIEVKVEPVLKNEEVLEKISKEDYVLALIDAQMKTTDCFKLIDMIHQNEETVHLPVIIMSAVCIDDVCMLQGIEGGAVDYIKKPLIPEILIGKVRVFLNLYNQKKALQVKNRELSERQTELERKNQLLEYEISVRKKVEEALQEQERILAEAQRMSRLGSWDWNLITDEMIWSDELYRIFEIHPGASDLRSAISERIHPEDYERYTLAVDKSITECTPYDVEYRIVVPSGSERHIHAHGEITIDNEGKIMRFAGTAMDITERKEAEQKVKEIMEKLEQSNADLGQFAYIVSHDLQEPLRMVSSYCQLLAKRYSDKLDDNAKEFIEFAVDGAERMRTLITDLLKYSRVGTRGQPFTDVDLNKPLSGALANLKIAIEESGAEITHDKLPVLNVDETQIVQLYQNLIGNAIKFQNGKTPRIHLGAKKEKHKWLLSVQDNGIGIDPKHIDKVFGVFQRFHANENYPGTGIGLAVCKRIIDRHNGRIWAESESGNGSTFYFEIPIANEVLYNEMR